MPLKTNDDQSHDFYLPTTPNIVRDIDNFLQPRATLPPVHAIGSVDWDIQQIAPGFGYYRLNLYEPRGRYRQRADFTEGHNMQADGDLVADDQGILRHSFQTVPLTGTAMAGLQGLGMVGDDFSGVTVIGFRETAAPKLFQDTGSYEPSISAVAGYSADGATSSTCLLSTTYAGGVPILLRGFLSGPVGPLTTLQYLFDLANPPTRGFYANMTAAIYGLCQTPLDGNAVMIYAGVLLRTVSMNDNPATAVFNDRAAIPPGGYTVGMIAFGHNPEIFHVVPGKGQQYVNAASAGSWVPALGGFRGKIVRTDLRGLVLQDFETNFLPYVTHCTAMPNAMFMCDEHSHYYVTQGANLPVDIASDRLPDANVERICTGHTRSGHKCLYHIDETHFDLSVTVHYVMEFDSLTRTVQQVSKRYSLAGAGRQSNGGASLPRSQRNGHIYDYVGAAGTAADSWLVQYQPDANEVGYNARKTEGAPAGKGRRFELTGYRRTPKMSLPGHPRAVMTVAAITGPTRASLRTGDQAGDRTANITVEATGTALAGFRSSDNVERRGVRAFPGNNSWFPELEVQITSTRGNVGLDASRYTQNVYPITIEGFWSERPLEVPTEYASWNQSI